MILTVEDLVVKRGGRTILKGVSLEANAGEVVGLVGPNGCGKSTLLAAVAGVLAPRDGRVAIAGKNVWGTSRERAAARRALGYVPEGADPPGFLLASELWALCATSRGVALPGAHLRGELGLDELATLALERMSLGQRRRACLGAAFLGPPELLVLDEPDNGLDAKRAATLVSLLREHAAAGHAALVATHDVAMLGDIGARTVTLGA